MARASSYFDYCDDCRRRLNLDALTEVRDRASGATVRVCRTCRRKRQRLRRGFKWVGLLGGAAVLLFLLAPALARLGERVVDAVDEPSPRVGGGVRVVPEMNSSWLFRRLNAERRRAGVAPLDRDRAAFLLAQENSEQMAEAERLMLVPVRDLQPFRHSGSVRQSQFVYEGGSAPRSKDQVFAELVNRDRELVLAARFNRVGVGVERRPGVLWVTLLFVRV